MNKYNQHHINPIKINCNRLAYILTLCVFVFCPEMAYCQNVTNNNDSGLGSLREVIAQASDGATITFSNSGAIQLLTPIATSKNLTISGQGIDQTIIDGSAMTTNPNLFSLSSNSMITFENMSFKNSGTVGSTQWGGAIYFNNASGKLVLDNCLFDNNRAFLGGAIRIQSGNLILYRCVFKNNSSDIFGGAINTRGTSHEAYSCLFYNNSSGSTGGAIHNETASWNIYNSTFVQNNAATGGGAISNTSTLNNVLNNIFYNNTTTSGSGPNISSSSITSGTHNLANDFSGSSMMAGANNNISSDPMFVDFIGEDFHLTNESPVINIGTTYTGISSNYSKDLDNIDRQLFGFPELGCYEFDNDLCTNAILLVNGTNQIGSNIGATNSASSVCGNGVDAGNGVWYTFPGTGNEMGISTNNTGTDFDTELVVYSGTCQALNCFNGNDNVFFNETKSGVGINATSGTDYFVYVDGNGTTEGNFELSLETCNAGFSYNGVNSSQSSAINTVVICDDATPSVNVSGGQFVPNSTNLTIDPSTGMVNFDNSFVGTYSVIYTLPNGCKEYIDITIAPPPANAGDEPDTIGLYPNNGPVDLFDGLVNEDAGGTWSSITQPPSSGFNAANGTFDPLGLPIGINTLAYTVAATSSCSDEAIQYVYVYVRIDNDECSGAIEIPISTGCTNFMGSNVGATDSYIFDMTIPDACAGYEDDLTEHDVWYKIDVPANTTVKIQGTSISGNSFEDGDMALYSGTCGPGGLMELACVDGDSENDYEPIIYQQNSSSTTETWFIRYWSYENDEGEFNICVTTEVLLATNDECLTAQALTIGQNGCTNILGSNIGATGTDPQSLSDPDCGDYLGGDVWYSMTVAAESAVKIETSGIVDGIYIDGEMEIYEGSCGSLNLVQCINDEISFYVNTSSNSILIFVRYWSYDNELGEFNICATATPIATNDECTSATPLTIGTDCNFTVGTNVGATATQGLADPACGDYEGGDVWYSMTVAAESAVKIETSGIEDGIYLDGEIEIYEGSCGSLSLVQCKDDEISFYVNTSPNQMPILVRYWSEDNELGEFNICATETPIATNDECTSATPLTIGTDCNFTVGTNVGATASQGLADPACTSTYNGGDVWYSITVQPGQYFEVDVDDFNLNVDMELYKGDCTTLIFVLCTAGEVFEFGNTSTSSTTYFLRIWDTNNDDIGTFNICAYEIPPPPVNDLCDGAISLTIGAEGDCSTNAEMGTTAGASSIGQNCGEGDVWYSFMNENTDPVIINVDNIVQVGGDPAAQFDPNVIISIYSGSCSSLVSETDCTNSSKIQFSPEANTTYYVNVSVLPFNPYTECGFIPFGAYPDGYTFDICIYDCLAPLNDMEANAQTIPSTTLPACVSGSTFCAEERTVFYNFTPTTSGFYTFTGSAELPQSLLVFDVDGFPVVANGVVELTVGTSYSIEVGVLPIFFFEEVESDFSFCIELCEIANDVCIDAIPLDISPFCCESQALYYFGCGAPEEGSALIPDQEKSLRTNKSLGGCVSGNAMWYSATVPVSGELVLNLDGSTFFSTIDFDVEVFSGPCNNLVGIDCGSTVFGDLELELYGLSPGTTVYFQIGTQSLDTYGYFTMCLYDPNPIFCPDNLNISGSVAGVAFNSTVAGDPTDGLIESDQIIEATATVDYSAGKEIILNENFEVKGGAVFHAYIDGCDENENNFEFSSDVEDAVELQTTGAELIKTKATPTQRMSNNRARSVINNKNGLRKKR